MEALFVTLSIIAAVLMIGVVLIQKSKGGGLSSSFASSNQLLGVRRTNSFIEKLTWGLGIAIAVFAIAANLVVKSPAAATYEDDRVDAAPTAAPAAGDSYDTSLPDLTAPEAPAAPEN